MVQAAILGYGTVGAGVLQVLNMNHETIARRVGDEVNVKYVLDLREFPGTPAEKILTHNYQDILDDPEVGIVVETMGGLKPAYEFTKQALLAGKNVCTSNKELVAEHGVELRKIAREHSVNYLFEASCGGGIPIIRAINESMTADEFEEVSGILNGTTNYILTSMADEGKSFEEALKEAQAKGYAELHPEADVEGYDACRKIAILSSLAYGKHISYKDVQTEGITAVDQADIAYAKALGLKIKLIAKSSRSEKGTWAMVAPMMIGSENQLYTVDGVMNAVFVKGNALGDAMFYGSGAGSLPTASAVAGDVLECAKHLKETIRFDDTSEAMELLAPDEVTVAFFARTDASEEAVKKVFGEVQTIRLPEYPDETGFVTSVMTEAAFAEACKAVGGVKKFIRRG
ncbi:MAG: homoserine dehydrogenase [Lachnospiraceae bacterium]|nr:homoserine dehydrogenase [Lachnospiraceae bacterium]